MKVPSDILACEDVEGEEDGLAGGGGGIVAVGGHVGDGFGGQVLGEAQRHLDVAILVKGAIAADFLRGEKSLEKITDLMAGGDVMEIHGGHAPPVERLGH
ncbi:MAG: hypothetical protein KDF64_18595 [Geminicoccaceae bacterium]|nr:hypothetical protein [Geminicoccaceae bacterium]